MKNTKRVNTKKRTRVVNKARFMLFCSMCALVLTISVGTITSAQTMRFAQSYTLCVASGDTLWEIARASNTKGKDLRKIVDDIIKLNNMRSTAIKTGDMLQIPIY